MLLTSRPTLLNLGPDRVKATLSTIRNESQNHQTTRRIITTITGTIITPIRSLSRLLVRSILEIQVSNLHNSLHLLQLSVRTCAKSRNGCGSSTLA